MKKIRFLIRSVMLILIILSPFSFSGDDEELPDLVLSCDCKAEHREPGEYQP